MPRPLVQIQLTDAGAIQASTVTVTTGFIANAATFTVRGVETGSQSASRPCTQQRF